MDRIGWIGVGHMGRPMVARLVDAGFRPTLLDIDPAKIEALRPREFDTAASPRELGDRCDVVFFSLPTLDAVRSAILAPDGLLAGTRLKVLVNTCTIGTALVAEIDDAARGAGIELVDAPISGGPEAAWKGVLSVMVSGPGAAIERLRPLLAPFGVVTQAGERAGAAQMLKLVNNLIILSAYAGTLEAVLLGAKAGLDPQIMLKAINAGSLAPNGTTRTWLPNYILKGIPFGATLEMMVKDMNVALAEGERFGVPMAVCGSTGRLARDAVAAGLGPEDVTALVRLLEDGASFTLPRTPDPR